jgi:glutamate/tyrosine decarboxylase-like PLP-dependent enzyme
MSKFAHIQHIKELERLSKPLELDPNQRASLTEMTLSYAESLIEKLIDAPAFRLAAENGHDLQSYPISDELHSMEEIVSILKDSVDNLGVNPLSSGNMGYIPGGSIYASALGDFLAAVSNRYSGHFYGSPGAVRMENFLLRWIADIVGYPKQAAGNLTSGGSIAQLIALVTAREAFDLKSRDYHQHVVYFTEQAHHSVMKGLVTAGLKDAVQHLIPTDEDHRMKVHELETAIKQDKKSGLHPWLVVATAGSTNTGTIDPLKEIAAVARQNQIWYHVDGAYGAFFALCDIGKRALSGMDESDSIILDPHKGLFLPYGTGAVLIKNGQALKSVFTASAPYAQDAAQFDEEFSPSDLSPELSRHFRGLRLWLPLMLVGIKPFQAALEEKLLLAQYFHQRLQEIDGFTVGSKPDLSIVPFRYLPNRGEPDAFNQKLIKAIQEDGRIFLSSTTLNGSFFIRMAILGVRTHLDTIDHAIEILTSKAKSISQA